MFNVERIKLNEIILSTRGYGFTQNIRDLGIRFLCKKTNEFVFLQIELIWDIVPGAMHLKSLI